MPPSPNVAPPDTVPILGVGAGRVIASVAYDLTPCAVVRMRLGMADPLYMQTTILVYDAAAVDAGVRTGAGVAFDLPPPPGEPRPG